MSSTARTLAPLILFAAIIVSLFGAIVFGFVNLLWLGQPLGASGSAASFVCLSVFGVASLVLLILHLRDLTKPAV